MHPPLLQPLQIGDLLDTAFRLYRRNVAQLIRLTSLVIIPLTLVRLLLLASPLISSAIDFLQVVFLLPLIGATLTIASARLYQNETCTPYQAYQDGSQRYFSFWEQHS